MVALCVAGGCAPQRPASNTATESKEATPAAPSAPPSNASTTDFEKLHAREAEGLTPVDVTGPEKLWQFRTPAKGVPKVAPAGKSTTVEIPIGSESSVHCEILEGDFDGAGTIENVIEDAKKRVKITRIAPAAVRVHRGDPSLFVDAVYVGEAGGRKGLGELKIGILPTPKRTAVCLHDELGYEKTFGDVAAAVFESITRAESALSKASYREASVATVGPVAVGFETRRLLSVQGKPVFIATTAMVMPAAEDSLLFVDGTEVEKVAPDGFLEEANYVRLTNGQVEMSATVKRKKGATYTYDAELGGKKSQGEFTVKGKQGLSARVTEAKNLIPAATAKGAFKWEALAYVPDTDAANGTPITYQRAASDPPRTISVSTGKQQLSGVLDEHGTFEKVDMPVGGATLHIERAFVEGKM